MVVSRDGAGAPSGGGAGSDDSGGSVGTAGPGDADSAGGGTGSVGGDDDDGLGGTAPSSDDDNDPVGGGGGGYGSVPSTGSDPAETTVDSITRNRGGEAVVTESFDAPTGGTIGDDAGGDPATQSDSGVLDDLGESYTETVAEPVGDFVAATSPVAAAERATLGTDRIGSVSEGFGEGVAQIGNIPGNAAGAIDAAQSFDRAQSRANDPVTIGGVPTGLTVPDFQGQERNTELAAGAAAGAASAAAESPFETTGRLLGGAAGGAAASRVVTRQLDTAPRPDAGGSSSPLSDLSSAVDLEDFRSDTRAQLGRGRRTDSDTNQETVTIARDADDRSQADRTLDETPGVNIDEPTVDLEGQLRQMADEADTGRQRTPRQRAEDRVPEPRAFESPAARQREITRLEERFRRDDMSDLDNRVVPRQTRGVDETTAGRFGLDDLGGAALGGSTTTTQAVESPSGFGAAEAEPEVTTDTASGILGGAPALGAATAVDADSAGAGTAPVGTDTTTDTTAETGTDTRPEQVAEPLEDLRATTTVGAQQAPGSLTESAASAQTLAQPDLATGIGVQQTEFAGGVALGGDTPTRRAPRGEETEEDDELPPGFGLAADADVLDSGIASSDELVNDIGDGFRR